MANESAFRRNGLLNYQRKSWTEYPVASQKYRDNFDKTFGKKRKPKRKSGTDDPTTPPPGSDEALALGCKCPTLDNERGRGYCGQPGVYVTSADCPLHSPRP